MGQARKLLASAAEDDETPVVIPAALLADLNLDDIPDGASFQVGTEKDHIIHLASRLFEQVPGFSVTGRIRTATEEIDISIPNDSPEPRLRRESALVLVECKNWNGKCGKDEFVIFREKLENRNRRSSLGFLISWNGFTSTVTKEMLRGSREETLIVPVTGKEIRAAVRSGEFLQELVACWDRAVTL